ncbi:FkbM family methyltransferase [Mesorhizobium sp. 10J20-29]
MLDKSPRFRKIYFDSQAPGSILLARTNEGLFLVNTSDKAIGRNSYINRRAFDFDKFEKLMSILPMETRRTTLVDVGANLGSISISALNRGYFRNAIAIEPEPENFRLLSSNVAINELSDRFTLFNLAAGETDDEHLAFEVSDRNFGDHRVRTSTSAGRFDEDQRKVIKVRSARLDKILDGVDSSEVFLWIDTQGFEGAVLAGAERLLLAKVPVCLEFWPYGLRRSGGLPKLLAALKHAHYSTMINLDQPNIEEEFNVDKIDELFMKLVDGTKFVDIVLV